MAEVNVYQQYFEASAVYNGIERHAANVLLIATSENGEIKYEFAVSFFPHQTPDDFVITYDAYLSKILYQGKGRRSKKRESVLLESLHDEIDKMSKDIQAVVYWNKPLIEARLG